MAPPIDIHSRPAWRDPGEEPPVQGIYCHVACRRRVLGATPSGCREAPPANGLASGDFTLVRPCRCSCLNRNGFLGIARH